MAVDEATRLDEGECAPKCAVCWHVAHTKKAATSQRQIKSVRPTWVWLQLATGEMAHNLGVQNTHLLGRGESPDEEPSATTVELVCRLQAQRAGVRQRAR
eukprot:scaffold127222_cov32-Tisochrysis_lutea.AAC.11